MSLSRNSYICHATYIFNTSSLLSLSLFSNLAEERTHQEAIAAAAMEVEKHDDEVVEGKVDWKGRAALKNKHGGMRAAFLVMATFGFENMATLALAVNLVTYFFMEMHFELSDAANSLTNFMGVSYILSILAAVFADTWIGRFKTVVISGCLEFFGLALLTVQAHYPSLRPSKCIPGLQVCPQVSGGNEALLFFALYVLATGSGGIKAALPPHGADQFDEKDPKEAVTMSSYFNYLLLALCVGGVVSFTLIVWVQDNKGWDWGFLISTVAIFSGVVVFLAGLPMYRIHSARGSSAITEIIQVYVAAIRKRSLALPADASELYEINKDKEANLDIEFVPHGDTFRFLDKAAIIENYPTNISSTEPQTLNPWKLCRVTQVENAKIILSMLPIFGCTIIMTLCLAQLQTFSVQQGSTMDCSVFSKSFNIPPASLPIIPIVFLIIIIPIYDKLVVPALRRLTGIPTGITYLQRIGVGLVLSAISMAIAALVEVKRRDVAKSHNMIDPLPINNPPLPITIFWLCFQYFVFGIADMFTYVGLLEFFYAEAPKGIKSISTCFLWSSMAFGYFFSSILVKIVNGVSKGETASGGWLAGNNLNRNHLDLFYWLLAIMSLVNFCAYLFVSSRYKYRSSVGSANENGKDKE